MPEPVRPDDGTNDRALSLLREFIEWYDALSFSARAYYSGIFLSEWKAKVRGLLADIEFGPLQDVPLPPADFDADEQAINSALSLAG